MTSGPGSKGARSMALHFVTGNELTRGGKITGAAAFGAHWALTQNGCQPR